MQLYEFACEGLNAPEACDPYLKIDFDNYKLFKSNVEQNTRNPEWSFKAGFLYEIPYLEKLKNRSLRIQCFNRINSQNLGEAALDLHTIACGPSHIRLSLSGSAAEDRGVLRFCCVMKMIAPDFTIICQDLQLTMLGCPASASMLINCSLFEAEHRTVQVPHSREGHWSGPFALSLETSLADVLKTPLEHLSFVVLDETSVRQGEAILEFRKAFCPRPDTRVPFKVPVTFTCTEGASDWAQGEPIGAVGELEGALIYRNLPAYAQMFGGLCVDGQVDGGFWLFDGLPYPQTMQHPPPLLQDHLDARGMEPLGSQPEGTEEGEVQLDDIHEEWFVEAIEKVDLPPPWEKRRVRGGGDRPGRMYFLDPRSKRTTWKDPRFLPDSWDQRVDPGSGKVYFQYHKTRKTTYVDPRSCPVGWDMRLSKDGEIYFAFLPAMRTTLIDPRGLPDNFDAALDDSARMYFKNHENQSTTWDDPRSGQQEVTLTKWRQAQSTRWWKEQVWREIEEMNRRKEEEKTTDPGDDPEIVLERGSS